MEVRHHGEEDADPPCTIDKYRPALLTGVATMECRRNAPLSARRALRRAGQAQMLSWYPSDTLG
jgi:hypothetical protein